MPGWGAGEGVMEHRLNLPCFVPQGGTNESAKPLNERGPYQTTLKSRTDGFVSKNRLCGPRIEGRLAQLPAA